MTTRQEKVNSLLSRELSRYILQENFEGITGLFTITKVEVTADLELAKVYFSVINQDAEEVKKILQKHIYQIQGWVNMRLRMRKVPRILFENDHSSEYASKIEKLIKEL